MQSHWFEWLDERIGRIWICLLAIGAVAGLGASQLTLDGDLSRLLPADTPSVVDLERLEGVYADQIGRLTVVLQSGTPESRRAVARVAAERIRTLTGVDRVTYKQPLADLDHRRLLYAELDDLVDIESRFDARIRWEKSRANPLFASLDSETPPAVDISDIEQRYADSGKGASDDADGGWLEGVGGELLVFVHPSFPASDLDRSRSLIREVSLSVDTAIARVAAPETSFSLTGRYQKRIEQEAVLGDDIRRASAIASLILALFLWLYFRQLWSVLLVLVPLVGGMTCAAAAAWFLFGELNILTGFLGAVLLGIGVDYGIHLVSRLSSAQSTELSATAVLSQAYSVTGRANVYAAITTAISLGTLGFSGFRAFHEFGVIAFVGLGLILTAYFVVLPALVLVAPRLRRAISSSFGNTPEVRPRTEPVPPSIRHMRDAGVPSGEASSARISARVNRRLSAMEPRHRDRLWRRLRLLTTGMLAALLVLGGLGTMSVSFDRSFDRLMFTESSTWRLDRMVNDIIGTSQTPAVVLVDGPSHRDAVVAELNRREAAHGTHLDGGDSLIGDILSTADIVPNQQTKKLTVLRHIGASLAELPASVFRANTSLRTFRRDLERVIQEGPITFADLPRSITMPFTRKDISDGSVVLVMPDVDLNDWAEARRFSRLTADLPAGQSPTPISAISDSRLLVDIFDQMEAELYWMLPFITLAILVVGFLAFGFRRPLALLVGLMAGGFLAVIGVIGWFDLPLNFMSALAGPVLIGLGVDAAFHTLVHRFDEDSDDEDYTGTQAAISASYLTTMIGFGALILAHHSGLQSLGIIAVCGLGTLLVFNLTAAIWLLAHRRSSLDSTTVPQELR